jgi:hypothetical protein
MGVALVPACATTDDEAPGGNGGPGGGTGGGLSIDGGGGVLDDGGECASEEHTGKQLPVDLYVMLDRSWSMTGLTAAGTTKWGAVTDALSSFVSDPKSAGLGVGLQYFPILQPEHCTSNADCGTSGPCAFRVCCSSLLGVCGGVCSTNKDCGRAQSCSDVGACSADPVRICVPPGSTCPNGGGTCVKLTESFCGNAESCTIGDYATPDVPIGSLPDNESALIASIALAKPAANTPTSAALRGAIEYAKSRARDNPTHRVAIVLATDGLPTLCQPTNIDQIAQFASQAAAQAPAIQTFVIGVFAQNDTDAQVNLNKLASAGGTSTAFMVDASGNVAQQFQKALDEIRGATLSCDFQLPKPVAGTVDFGKVNVDVSSSLGVQKLYYAESADKCDPQQGGWYYDVNPATGTPTRIIVCPSTCSAFEATQGLSVKIRLGCKTEVLPPR